MKEETWETVQIRTFVNWVNNKLEKGEERYKNEKPGALYFFKKVENFPKDLQDGRTLLSLLYSLTGSIFTYNQKPTLIVHKRDNIEKVINYLKQNNVQMINIGAADIEEGSIKLTLALIWRLIISSSLNELRERIGNDSDLRKKLLDWCRAKTSSYPGVSIMDFEGSWRDGLALSALVHSEVGGFSYEEGTPYERAARALSLAKKHLDVPTLISASDLTEGRCDDKSLMTYLLEMYMQSIRNEESLKKERERKAVKQTEDALMHLLEKRKVLCDLQRSNSVSLERVKKELDALYTEMRKYEEENVENSIKFVLQTDVLNRLKNPYTSYTLAHEILPEQVPITGIFDSYALRDTLKRWEHSEGSSSSSSILLLQEAISKISSLPSTITFLGSISVLYEVQSILDACKEQVSLSSHSYEALEKEAILYSAVQVIRSEIEEGIKFFENVFSNELKKEKYLIKKFSSSEVVSLSDSLLPSPSSSDLLAFTNEEHFNYVVSEAIIMKKEGLSSPFTSISTSIRK
ncbi:hypothetical protein NEFER03_2181 [Nematocida sp. LUAm3]|nr:hypothetical protein NEFER03_2181 [Nematocida sp. LUAm3]KAI5176289.1 hypothetical protein NEFER02_2081 [Nematocida sp. LUAm2]KAI5179239.1 hypothetical protein NEFER01_2093 [Nematocida sp. LUAm1]